MRDFLELIGSYKTTNVILAAVELDLFAEIGNKKMTAKELARQMKTDHKATGILLNFLCRCHMILKEGDRYSNIPRAGKFLSRDSMFSFYPIFKFEQLLKENLITPRNIVERIKHGRDSCVDPAEVPGFFEVYMDAMARAGLLNAAPIVRYARLRDGKKLLDLGGGPGTFHLSLLRLLPAMKIVLYELPEVAEKAKEIIAKEEIGSKNIEITAGDFTRDDLGSGYDYVLMSNVLHFLTDNQTAALLKKVRASINEKGELLIHDFFLDEEKTGPAAAVQFTIDWLTYGSFFNKSAAEISGLLLQSGFKETEYTELPNLPTGLIKARV
jgi:SAM-dependent methyltransferase